MKKSRGILLAVCLVISVYALFFAADTGTVTAAETKEITVLVDSQPLTFDVPPAIINGRTMVPFRAIFEALGATVNWDGATQTVSARKGADLISFPINSPTAVKNGSVMDLDVPAQIVNGRTLVPARFVSLAMGASVIWDDLNKTVIITTGDGWKTSTPSEQGLDPQIINTIYEDIIRSKLKVDSFLVVKNGSIVTEKYFGTYNQDSLHPIYSDTKSITSILTGITRDKGKINLDDSVVNHFPDRKFDNISADKDSITVRNLLTMTCGLQWPYTVSENGTVQEMALVPSSYPLLMQSGSWVDFVMNCSMATKPGTVFNYNTGNTEVLSAILNKVNGMTEEEFARQYLFGPLGITNYKWAENPEGYSTGGTGLAMRPRDMAKIGQLMLQRGVWNGQQIVSADWVTEATTAKISSAVFIPESGYGYNWWIKPDIQGYFAAGLSGQIIYVLPNQNMVVVFTANEDMGTMLRLGKSSVQKLQS